MLAKRPSLRNCNTITVVKVSKNRHAFTRGLGEKVAAERRPTCFACCKRQ